VEDSFRGAGAGARVVDVGAGVGVGVGVSTSSRVVLMEGRMAGRVRGFVYEGRLDCAGELGGTSGGSGGRD
jgi:hypothetical protein